MRKIKDMLDIELIHAYVCMKEQYKNAYAAIREIEEEFSSRADMFKKETERKSK